LQGKLKGSSTHGLNLEIDCSPSRSSLPQLQPWLQSFDLDAEISVFSGQHKFWEFWAKVFLAESPS
jgi:hypothetical protein